MMSSPAATAVSVVLVILILYFLSIGPVTALTWIHTPRTLPVIVAVYAPVLWLGENTPLGEPIGAYVRWWWGILDAGP